MGLFYCAYRRLNKPTAVRILRTAGLSTQSHHLTSESPYVRAFGSPDAEKLKGKDGDFLYFPDFFSQAEQETLLKLALWKLDRVDPRRRRRRRRKESTEPPQGPSVGSNNLQCMFDPSSDYGFEDGHFDSVITRYRESLITAFPNPSNIGAPSYSSILKRVYDLLPQSAGSELARDLYYDKVLPERSPEISPALDQPFEQPLQTSTHALHLAPDGYILPHVDNVDASGTVIIGVSLGADRILRLEEATQDGPQLKIAHKGWDVLLNSGSLYIQKDSIRYEYAHSILPYGDESVWNNTQLVPGHRVSLMVRDIKPEVAS